MYQSTRSMSKRLVSAKMALTNALADQHIKETLMELGFDEARLQAGLELYNRTEHLYQVQKRQYSEQYAATVEFNRAWKEADAVLRKYVTAARLVTLDESTLKNSLGLDQGHLYAISDWITRARLFYQTALEDPGVLEKLQVYAVTAEKLQAGLAQVDRVEELNGKQKIESSEAQQATRDRDASFKELDRYMSQLKRVARVLLTEKPEYLEKLGILERSVPIRKKKEEETEGETPEEPADPGPPEVLSEAGSDADPPKTGDTATKPAAKKGTGKQPKQ